MHRQTDAVPSRTRRSFVPAACLLACLAPVTAASADPLPASPAATPPAAPAPTATGDLALDARGSAVLALQRTLFQLGLPVARDGRFGAATDAAVRRYQHEEGQPVTGVVTRAQRTAMRRKAAPRRRELAFASRSLRVGASGTDVRAAQRLLIDNGIKTPTHGAYTAAVRSRVQQWERQAKMRADGVLSPSEARLLRKTTPTPPGTETATPKSADDAAAGATGAIPAAAAAPVAVTTTGGYTFPIQGPWHWGGAATLFADRGGAHQGVDVFAACGTPLVAASSGTVAYNQYQSAAGNYVIIRGTPSGEDQGYMHMKARSPLAPGTAVTAGTPIGEVGDTGNADGCHLHFELWSAPGWYAGGAPRDPKADLTTWATQSGRPPSSSAR